MYVTIIDKSYFSKIIFKVIILAKSTRSMIDQNQSNYGSSTGTIEHVLAIIDTL